MELFLHLEHLPRRAGEQFMHALTADADLLRDFRQRQVLLAVQGEPLTLLVGQQSAIERGKPIQLDFLADFVLCHVSAPCCQAFSVDTDI